MGAFTIRDAPLEADAAAKNRVSVPLLLCEACNRTGEYLSLIHACAGME